MHLIIITINDTLIADSHVFVPIKKLRNHDKRGRDPMTLIPQMAHKSVKSSTLSLFLFSLPFFFPFSVALAPAQVQLALILAKKV